MSIPEVAAQLRRLRSEKAFEGNPERKPFRVPLWLAAFLAVFGIGFASWRIIGPAVATVRENAALAAYRSRLKADSGSQKAPDQAAIVLDAKAAGVPDGMRITLSNGRSEIVADNETSGMPLYAPRAKSVLKACLETLLAAFPTAPSVPRISIGYRYRGIVGTNQIDVTPGRAEPSKSTDASLDRVAAQMVDGFARPVEIRLDSNPPKAPPGFSIECRTPAWVADGGPISMLPIDAKAAAEAMRLCLIRRLVGLSGSGPKYPQVGEEARPADVPENVHFTVQGPLTTFGFDLPTKLGPRFPTSDALRRGQEAIMGAEAREVQRQIDALNDRSANDHE